MNAQLKSVLKIFDDPATLDEIQKHPEKIKIIIENKLAALPSPSKSYVDAIWLIIVVAFVLVLLFSAGVLGISMTTKMEQGVSYFTKSETILTLFTTVVGFLAGLLAPSPVDKKADNG